MSPKTSPKNVAERIARVESTAGAAARGRVDTGVAELVVGQRASVRRSAPRSASFISLKRPSASWSPGLRSGWIFHRETAVCLLDLRLGRRCAARRGVGSNRVSTFSSPVPAPSIRATAAGVAAAVARYPEETSRRLRGSFAILVLDFLEFRVEHLIACPRHRRGAAPHSPELPPPGVAAARLTRL